MSGNGSPRDADLTAGELDDLIQRVFQPQPEEREIAFLTDLPDGEIEDNDDWRERRQLALEWTLQLDQLASRTGRSASLHLYRHTGSNNADLPERAWLHGAQHSLPSCLEDVDGQASLAMEEIYRRFPIIIAPTQFSATAPLKQAARRFGFRGATMPGFNRKMMSALKLDWVEVDRRCRKIKRVLDESAGASFRFRVQGHGQLGLTLDLRHRQSTASGGLVPEPGTTGNLPSGETYIVPYEGERPGDPSRSEGLLPVQFGDEVVIYVIRQNRALAVQTQGPVSQREAELIEKEPAYANLAELGVGVLADFGVDPIGVILLDEKLAVHIAFGRSDHFGGQVSPADFTSPRAVVHIDRVYHPKLQPRVHLDSVTLHLQSGSDVPLVRDDQFVFDFNSGS
ncbi:MAG TPA: hypothetical protein VLU25_22395 [Acidobacteriota bacterium]|nr:hypothetical protein [Acidobacteriota bacterium]